MDGVFMRKIIKVTLCLFLLVSTIWLADVWQDKRILREDLIRLHVVANSDSAKDQELKLQVKNAIVAYLQPLVEDFTDKDEALAYINDNITSIEQVANEVLADQGSECRATAQIDLEAFDTREYQTFSLPAGVYDSLRIKIGDGCGRNWWCVVFPSLCLPATTEEFQDIAVSSGFSTGLSNTLSNGRNIRFYVLDLFGRLENIFH